MWTGRDRASALVMKAPFLLGLEKPEGRPTLRLS